MVGEPASDSGARLTELLGALSLGTDLAMGHPMQHVLRQTVIAVRLAALAGLTAPEREIVSYTSLLAWVGCHVDAYEQAKWFGDDLAVKHDIRGVELGNPRASAAFVLSRLGAGRSPLSRARIGLDFLAEGRRDLEEMYDNHWRTADALMVRLGLPQPVRDAVAQTFERWDGKGEPSGLRGPAVALPSRVVGPGRRGGGVPRDRRAGRRCLGGPGTAGHPVRPRPRRPVSG